MLTWKDTVATGFTAAVVLIFTATNESWDVPLIGGSHRWAAAAIFVIGLATCGLGSPGGRSRRLFPILGMLAFVFASVALVTGALTPLLLLVSDIVVMWALATFRHLAERRSHPATAA
jgi:hypothetical protein